MSSLGYLIKEGFKNLFNNRMMSLASIGVLISCLVLTGSAVMLTVNVTNIVDSVSDKNLTNVYLNDDMDHLHAVAIGQDLLAVDHVVDAQLIEKDEAMEAYREQLGEDIFQNMTGKGNPFPYSYRITVDTETMQNVEQYDAVVEQLKQVKLVRNGEVLGSVASVSSHRDMAQKLTSLSSLITMMSFWIILALAVISLFIIANTIRMTMFSHRFEISIMKSVGATNAFVRIPFIVEGIIIGLVSAVVRDPEHALRRRHQLVHTRTVPGRGNDHRSGFGGSIHRDTLLPLERGHRRSDIDPAVPADPAHRHHLVHHRCLRRSRRHRRRARIAAVHQPLLKA